MRKIVNVIFYIGFIFFGGGAVISLGQFVLYNGLGDTFEYIKPDDINYTIREDTVSQKDILIINYSYSVDGKQYNATDRLGTYYIQENNVDLSDLYYNKNFPFMFYIKDNSLYLHRCKAHMVIMMFFFLFIFSIYKFADLDKWINVYTKGEFKSTRK